MSLSRRAFLAASAALATTTGALTAGDKKKKLVLIAGAPSHGPGDHEFNAGVRLLDKCLKGFPGLETQVWLNGYPKDDSALDTADAILCFADGGGGHPLVRDKRLERVGKLMAKGVGLMCAHYGVEVLGDESLVDQEFGEPGLREAEGGNPEGQEHETRDGVHSHAQLRQVEHHAASAHQHQFDRDEAVGAG